MASPAFAPPDVKDVTLSLFGGRKTDIAPSDCPEGLALDEQDNIFLPGDVQSRPGLARLFAAGLLTANASVLYSKSYIQPDGTVMDLFLTSDGKLWVENVSNSPLLPNAVQSLPAGLYAQSVSAFGREYIAISDLLHGQYPPLQFDGVNLDRVTQDGPGVAPAVADETTTYTIQAAAVGLQNDHGAVTIASGSQTGFLVTLVINTAGTTARFLQEFRAGDSVLIAGVGAGYNGTWAAQGAVQFGVNQVALSYLATTAGLAPAGPGGTCSSEYYRVQLTTTSTVTAGLSITIAGAGIGGYNGSWPVRLVTAGGLDLWVHIPGFPVLANSGGGTVAITGSIAQGTHGVVQMFLTRQGSFTKPSPIGYWTATGGKRAVVSNLAIGPSNVVARMLGFTGAGGAFFFILPAVPQVSGTAVGTSTVVADNTSSQVTVDFADNTLFAGVPIDQVGNDLFDQAVLGPVAGFFAYASRLDCWGDYNKVENFLNMGFDGGFLSGTPLAPTGWTIDCTLGAAPGNGELVATGSPSGPPGFLWAIWGDGTPNPQGMIEQSAYQDQDGNAILSPSTVYDVRFMAAASTATGNLVFELFSATSGSIALVSIPLATIGASMKFYQARLGLTPAVIPVDMVLRIYGTSVPIGQALLVDENEAIFTSNPYRDTISRWSYAINPEAFALTTGNLGAADDESPIRCFALLRQTGLLETAEGVHVFQDNNSEPSLWNVNQLTRAVGALSLRSGDPGKFGTGDAAEDWTIIASKNGVYLFAGAEFWKISQEISRGALPQSQDSRITWDDINWTVQKTIVIKNDPSTRRAYFAVPVNGALTPNKVFVLDYREMDTATQIAGAAPLHITLQGKMRSSDLTRKWSVWNIAANDIEILIRPNNQRQIYFGGGNGLAIGSGTTYGNVYSLDPAKLTDDDYGAIAPFYETYFFTDHETEQGLGIGSDMHLVKRIHAFVAGVGMVTLTPIVNSLYNFMPSLSPRTLVSDLNAGTFLKSDLEWNIAGLRGQRIAFRISVQPLPGATDVQYRVQKFVVGMMKDPVAQFRQSGV